MLGPVEFLAFAFPGNKFKGEIEPELEKLVENKQIKIIDLVFVYKDEKGNVITTELENIDKETSAFFDKLGVDISGLISEEDILNMAVDIPLNSSAVFILFEHVWAIKFRDAVLNANGKLLMDQHIPVALIEEALKAKEKVHISEKKNEVKRDCSVNIIVFE